MTLPVILVVVLLTMMSEVIDGGAADEISRDSFTRVHRQISTRLGLLVDQAEGLAIINRGMILRGELDLERLEDWRLPWFEQSRTMPNISSVSFARPDGSAVWVAHYAYEGKYRFALKHKDADFVVNTALDDQGRLLKDEIDTYTYTPLNRPWYLSGTHGPQPRWVEPFLWIRPGAPFHYLGTGIIWGLRDDSGELLGVLDVEITLDDLSTFLETLAVGRTGIAFIVDKEGVLLASSTGRQVLGEEREPLRAAKAQDGLVSQAAQRIPAGVEVEAFERFQYQGRTQLMMTSSFRHSSGVDWRVVTVAPESDFTGKLEDARRRSWVVGSVAALATILFGLYLGWSIAGPIAVLAQSASRGEEMDAAVAGRKDEIGELARAFSRAQEKLHRSERYFRSLIENASDMTLVAGPDGALLYSSPAVERILGHRPQKLKELVHPEDHARLDELLATQGRSRPEEMRWLDREGEYRVVEAVAYRPADDSVDGLVLNAWDVTARRRAEELEHEKRAAVAAGQARAAFLANMSHELRTPMNSVIGFAEYLRRRLESSLGPRERDALETIERNSQHLLELINEILELSKLEAGKMPVHLETVEMSALAGEVVRALAPMAEQNQNVLQIEAEQASLQADRVKVRQILYNLISNACKFTREGRVDILGSVSDEAYTLKIRDTGIGISADDAKRLFTPFTQADASISQRFGGTGLGLAISLQYAELMGGEITVESVLGQGSTFTLKLPLRETSAEK